jgi:hypothetical protein
MNSDRYTTEAVFRKEERRNKEKDKEKWRKEVDAKLRERRGTSPQINDEMQSNYEHNQKLRTFTEDFLGQLTASS